ncbi:hypothetical protein C5O10_12335 [Akkermansia muciniphila]|nr:hypothetical protein C5O09_12285 [Akkermansia muciniphila]QHV17528.1 hypothetical protein C5O10_12335 [Akkermansia muciniphila]
MPCRNVFNGKGGDCVKCLWRWKKGEGGPGLPSAVPADFLPMGKNAGRAAGGGRSPDVGGLRP